MDKALLQHGAISWYELTTSDVEGAKTFYGKLFKWEFQEYDGDPAAQYNMIQANNKEVAGIMKTPPECSDHPPAWGGYVTVDDIDQTAEKLVSLGGKVLVPPTDIPNVGRFCVFSDPQGAILSAISYFKQE